jgi:DNA ligase-1
MRLFTRLYRDLDRTTKTSAKVAALRAYFEAAPPADAVWALHFLTGRRFRRSVTSRQMRRWVSEVTGTPEWLVAECHDSVGDLAETLTLLLDDVDEDDPTPLHEVIERRIAPLAAVDETRRREIVVDTWRRFSADERLVWHKLIMGGFRVGVAKKLVTRALAEVAGIEPAVMAHRLTGPFATTATAFESLVAADHDDAPVGPYPFFLAHPLEAGPETLGDVAGWRIEWKLDGIRAQLVRRGGHTVLWSRGEEMIGAQFPELVAAAALLPDGTVLDGEVVAWEDDRPLPFRLLQRRLGRKDAQPALWTDVPVAFVAFDLLEDGGVDLRGRPLDERCARLRAIIDDADDPSLRTSPSLDPVSWAEARALFARSRDESAEGLMLKRRSSPYRVGRTRAGGGDWWKWKVDPYTIDAVLIYAEQGHGKRAGLFTDYTFGVWEARRSGRSTGTSAARRWPGTAPSASSGPSWCSSSRSRRSSPRRGTSRAWRCGFRGWPAGVATSVHGMPTRWRRCGVS